MKTVKIIIETHKRLLKAMRTLQAKWRNKKIAEDAAVFLLINSRETESLRQKMQRSNERVIRQLVSYLFIQKLKEELLLTYSLEKRVKP